MRVFEKINFLFQAMYFRTHVKGLFKQPWDLLTESDGVDDCNGGGCVDIPKRRCIITLVNFLAIACLFRGAVSLLVLIPGCFSFFCVSFSPNTFEACEEFLEVYTADRRLGLEFMVFGDFPTNSFKCQYGPLLCLCDNWVSSTLYSPGYNRLQNFNV